MGRHKYFLEIEKDGAWIRVLGECTLEWGRGYVAHRRESPGPRLALRLVRGDGRVMDEAPGLADASIGPVAGWPTSRQYREAARRCLALAEAALEREIARDEP